MGTFISKLLLNVFIPTEARVLKWNRLFHINVKTESVIDVRVFGFLLAVWLLLLCTDRRKHVSYTGRFIMFSVITNIYKKKTKGPTIMEMFTATGKMKKN
jgi:hypothetical protein